LEVVAVLRFDPFRDLDRLAEQVLGAQAGTARAPRFMPMDLYRSGDHYVLHADLPGVDPGSIDVKVENGVLTVRAERTSRTEEGVQWIASERFAGTFMRQISLGEGVDADAISATYANGVLTVTIPIAEKSKSRRIEVTAATPEQTAIEAQSGGSRMSGDTQSAEAQSASQPTASQGAGSQGMGSQGAGSQGSGSQGSGSQGSGSEGRGSQSS
jgi:HSP20 family protein